jgi:nicotinamidase-related amidase
MTALLVIDAQVNQFDSAYWPVHAPDVLLARLRDLVARSRAARTPVLFVRNCGGPGEPDVLGTAGWEIHPELAPTADEPVFDKTTCDSFASTPLGEELERMGVRKVVIAGVQSDMCIRETSLGALARRLDVTLVSDGHAAFDRGGEDAPAKSAAVNAELADRVTLVATSDIRFD